MKLLDYLDSVRSRPESARRRFAIMTSVFFCGVIFIAWLMVVTSRSGTLHYSSDSGSSATPISSIAEGLRNFTGEIKTLGEVIKGFSASKTVVELDGEEPPNVILETGE